MRLMAGAQPEGRRVASRYHLLEPIGRGGMGIVWRAHDELLDREVAVKEVRYADMLGEDNQEDFNRRTKREARAAGRLTHPNVVVVHDVVEEDGRPWIVMQLVESRSLGKVLRQDGPLPYRRVAEIGLQVLEALRAAHAQGVLHRDVKPENVLLADDGRVVLTDFGIATLEAETALTMTGIAGTPAFIPPERIKGAAAQRESDLWSLGATLYAAVEGKPPHDRGGALPTMHAVLNDEPDAPVNAGPLAPVLEGLLRKDPDLRMSYEEASRLLREVAEGAEERQRPVRTAVMPALPSEATAETDPGIQYQAEGLPATGVKLGSAVPDPAQDAPAQEERQAEQEEPATQARRERPSGAVPGPVSGSVSKPARKPAAKPLSGPLSGPAPKQVSKPVSKPAPQPAPKPAPAAAGGQAARPAPVPPRKPEQEAASGQVPRPASAGKPPAQGAQNRTPAPGPVSAPAPKAGREPIPPVRRVPAPAPAPVPAPRDLLADLRPSSPRAVPMEEYLSTSPSAGGETPRGLSSLSPMMRGLLLVVPALVIVGVVAGYLGMRSGERAGGLPAPRPSEPTGATRPAETAKERSPDPSPSPSPSDSPTKKDKDKDSALPEGWHKHKDGNGFSVGLPKGWDVDRRQGQSVWFRGPDRVSYLLIEYTDNPSSDPKKDWEEQERYGRSNFNGYKRVRIEKVDYMKKAADWEFTWNMSSGKARVIDRGFVTEGGRGYAIYWHTRADEWDKNLGLFKGFTTTFSSKK
ncbi:protein kinase [Streptosporangium sp. NPDC051023]|uniref:protein kinase domain-containing protein n=1 Tax=Streptosporangium sp. NPDC051023 TaxID=3155410 RepID=UPI00344E549B